AATTSLPEEIGGERNWDYRFCWLRDSTLTLFALTESGYIDEAAAWRQWLLRAIGGDPAHPRIMYGVGGERHLTELELPWLAGYEGSKPVRIGNAASGQLQLDIYGELMDSLYHARRVGLDELDACWDLQRLLIAHLETIWRDPDEGIWEIRGPRRQFTHSRLWYGLRWTAPCARSRNSAKRARWSIGANCGRRSTTMSVRTGSIASWARSCSPMAARRWTRACCRSPWWASCAPTTNACAAPSRRSRGACWKAASCTATTPTRTWMAYPATRASSSPAASGWPIAWCCRAAWTRPARCLNGCSPCATTSACWPRNTIPRHDGNWATSRRRSRISPWSTPRTT